MIFTTVLLFQTVFYAVALQPTTTPPLLDVPTYSLATLNKDGTTNMNILTYATPVSVQPNRVWSLGIYRETLTEENLLRKPFGVLQLLTDKHIELVSILGGNSGRDMDKKEACERLGFEWVESGNFDGIQVLPGCASYLHMTIQGGLLDAGSHLIIPYCQVEAMFTGENAVETRNHLKTGKLRDLGIITDQGRVANMQPDLTKQGLRRQ